MPGGRRTGGVTGVQLRSGGGGGAGLLETNGDDWHGLCDWPGWWSPSSLDEESPSNPMHVVGDLDDAAAEETVTAVVTGASFFWSPEAAWSTARR